MSVSVRLSRPAALTGGRVGTRARPSAGAAAAVLAGVGAGAVLGSTLVIVLPTAGGFGGVTTAAGTLTAMLGTYLSLVLIVLVARVPWLERDIGQDRLVAWHRRLAPAAIGLIAAHVVLTTAGYAQSAGISWWRQFVELTFNYPWMLPATVAFVAMLTLGLLSIRRVRSMMRYETWWVAHLYFYLAVALAFGHQLTAGSVFVSHPLLRSAWIGLYAAVGAVVLISRFGIPLYRGWRHQLRVAAVEHDVPGVVTVTMAGRHLDHLPVSGGQFFEWRFLTRDWWWQAHPYSLSAAPDGRSLRITVKNLGDQSGALAHGLRPGTRVLAEGPYGVFTSDRARRNAPLVALAAGVGIAPVHSLLADLPADTRDVTLIYRVVDLRPESVALRNEVATLMAQRGWHLHYLTGEIEDCTIDATRLLMLAPRLADADVFACGPAGFIDRVREAASQGGVPCDRFHHELFVF